VTAAEPEAVTAPLLRVAGLRKAFGRNVVLDDLSLDVAAHDVVVLIGASGSGKSTLLRCVDLLEVVDDGVIELEGREITDPRVDADAVRARMGIVFQAFNLFPHLTVLDNVTLAPEGPPGAAGGGRGAGAGDAGAGRPARPRHRAPRRAVRRAAAAGRDRPRAGQRPGADAVRRGHLGAGPELVGEVLAMLRDLKSDGMTMIVATHEMGFARQVQTNVLPHEGRILERGIPNRCWAAPDRMRTRQSSRINRRPAVL
jgi:polar amino acid transport system ATP-binding protein